MRVVLLTDIKNHSKSSGSLTGLIFLKKSVLISDRVGLNRVWLRPFRHSRAGTKATFLNSLW